MNNPTFDVENCCTARVIEGWRPRYEGMRKDGARGLRGTLCTYARVRNKIVCERVQLGATLRAVTAVVNIANTGTGRATASDPDQSTCSLSLFLRIYSAYSSLWAILFYSRTTENV